MDGHHGGVGTALRCNGVELVEHKGATALVLTERETGDGFGHGSDGKGGDEMLRAGQVDGGVVDWRGRTGRGNTGCSLEIWAAAFLYLARVFSSSIFVSFSHHLLAGHLAGSTGSIPSFHLFFTVWS
jgi:hypothetical protein